MGTSFQINFDKNSKMPKLLKNIFDAPKYVQNCLIHKDTDMNTIDSLDNYKSCFKDHPNLFTRVLCHNIVNRFRSADYSVSLNYLLWSNNFNLFYQFGVFLKYQFNL